DLGLAVELVSGMDELAAAVLPQSSQRSVRRVRIVGAATTWVCSNDFLVYSLGDWWSGTVNFKKVTIRSDVMAYDLEGKMATNHGDERPASTDSGLGQGKFNSHRPQCQDQPPEWMNGWNTVVYY